MVECGIYLTEAEKQQMFLHNLRTRGQLVSDNADKETRLRVFLEIMAARPSIRTRDGLILGAEIGGLLTHEQSVQIRIQPDNVELILTG